MPPRNPGGPPCLSSRRSRAAAIGGISNPEPLLSWKVKPCLGADHTKESLSFAKQPSPFKGRNQSWFHPLRTPSRPGAAAPGPHGGWGQAVVSPHTIYRPRCTDRQLLGLETLLSSYGVLSTDQGPFHQGGSASSMEIPPIAADGGSVGMTVRVSRRDSRVRQRGRMAGTR